jgi:ankyrin repeat protein
MLFLSNNRNLFLKQCLSLILKKNLDKRTPIHESAKIGNFPMLEFFFGMINNENIRNLCEDSDDEFKTSLHLAAAEGKNLKKLKFIYNKSFRSF